MSIAFKGTPSVIYLLSSFLILILNFIFCFSSLLQGENPGCLDCSEHFTSLHMWPVDDRIMPYIVKAGFAHFVKLRWFRLDRALITALIERWRRETHTFHLPFGEMTITLQDVAILLGLHIDGDAVSGTTMIDDWPAVARRLLGQIPPPYVIRGGRIALTWLYQSFTSLQQKASEEVVQQYARAYLLHLLGAPISLMLFEDFDTAGRYAWGSATLAFLFRELKGCQAGAEGVAGCLSLLQLWIWEHLDVGRPHLLENRIEVDGSLGTRYPFVI
ncbi:LOW QUALITY PROTEIN: protein MAIN-LIKE 1-like [Aristolochia californica]|uniref:LOW QUALITY PROTEIN: protein MAIN-LIKE 1-like n=1 Tax=Aristolochia californica TaxID=171875 RepID=UPI0035D6CBC8